MNFRRQSSCNLFVLDPPFQKNRSLLGGRHWRTQNHQVPVVGLLLQPPHLNPVRAAVVVRGTALPIAVSLRARVVHYRNRLAVRNNVVKLRKKQAVVLLNKDLSD
jgi:hypothetical protein